MTPVDHGWEARYLRASRACHTAWANSQPQYVIPGVLEEVQATRADGDGCGLPLLELVSPSYASPQGGGLDNANDGPGRMSSTDRRGRGHWR